MQYLNTLYAEPAREAHERAIDAIAAGHGLTVMPPDLDMTDLERYLPARRRPQGFYSTEHLESFVGLCSDLRPGMRDKRVLVEAKPQTLRAAVCLDADSDVGIDRGHHEWGVRLELSSAPEFSALLNIGCVAITQRGLAEFLEDYEAEIENVFDEAGTALSLTATIAAVRRVTIEQFRNRESAEGNFASSRSGMETIEAKSQTALPAAIVFRCVPFRGLKSRSIRLRVSIRTGKDDPAFVLRIVRFDELVESIGEEFVQTLAESFPNSTVRIATFAAKA